MNDQDALFLGTIPAYYDRCLGPFLFEPYAADLARRVAATPDSRVLELACGTGIATRRLRRALARGRAARRHRLERRDDRDRAREARRSRRPLAHRRRLRPPVQGRRLRRRRLPVRPDVPAGPRPRLQRGPACPAARRRASRQRVVPLDENPAAGIIHAVLSRMFADDPPQFLRVPYGSLDADALRALAAGAGFTTATVSRVALEGRAAVGPRRRRRIREGHAARVGAR